ncbi:MAG: putative cupredoxin-like copper-binding protein [Candidatus Promineifilaceae bacterium]|jgi:uncharacterized cupredoxin-like copper-binding protein
MSFNHFIFFCLAACLLLVGCGGTSAESAALNSVSLTLKGMDTLKFDQDTLTAPAGAIVNLTFENVGTLDHNFLIAAQQDVELVKISETDATPGTSTGVVSGGATHVYKFVAPFEPGDYVFACSIPGHAASGMAGTFTVTE